MGLDRAEGICYTVGKTGNKEGTDMQAKYMNVHMGMLMCVRLCKRCMFGPAFVYPK